MTLDEFGLEHLGTGEDSGADDKEGGSEVHGAQVVQQKGSVRGRSVVIRETPGHLIGTHSDIRGSSYAIVSPVHPLRDKSEDPLHPPQVHQHRPSVIALGDPAHVPSV